MRSRRVIERSGGVQIERPNFSHNGLDGPSVALLSMARGEPWRTRRWQLETLREIVARSGGSNSNRRSSEYQKRKIFEDKVRICT